MFERICYFYTNDFKLSMEYTPKKYFKIKEVSTKKLNNLKS